jgi:hypothetical protein
MQNNVRIEFDPKHRKKLNDGEAAIYFYRNPNDPTDKNLYFHLDPPNATTVPLSAEQVGKMIGVFGTHLSQISRETGKIRK